MHFPPTNAAVKIDESPSENPGTAGAQASAVPIPENANNRRGIATSMSKKGFSQR
jgi:hypothetical protein